MTNLIQDKCLHVILTFTRILLDNTLFFLNAQSQDDSSF
jgi:hypothetical protein